MALAKTGCQVRAICPPSHLLAKVGVVGQPQTYRWMTPLASFAEAITATRPDLIIPCDDLATQHLHRLHQRARRRPDPGASICALIERSLGAPEYFPLVYARTRCLEIAREEGVRVPETSVIPNLGDLRKWTDRVGFPAVLKANGTSGGEGVRIVRTFAEAELALRNLQAPPSLAKAAKWALIDREMALVSPALLRQRSVVNAQKFVEGREATTLVACWKGEVLAGLHFEVLHTTCVGGPACVLRLIDNAEMVTASRKMVRRLNLSGLHGFDFMLASNSEGAYLIEINPRATQVAHITLGPGRDLPAALRAILAGESVHVAPELTEKDTIALFPGEWTRNPESGFLRSGYHDVPWECPDLVRACVIRRLNKKTIFPWRAKAQALVGPSQASSVVPEKPPRIV
jgi:hypothetical protein